MHLHSRKYNTVSRLLRTVLCLNNIFNPGYNQKMLMRKRTFIVDRVWFIYEQFFHPVQQTACRICQCSSRDILALPEETGIVSTSEQFHYLLGIKCSGNGTRQYSICLYQPGCSHLLFSYHYILSVLGKIFLVWNQSFCMSGNCCISYTVKISFSGEVFGVESTT